MNLSQMSDELLKAEMEFFAKRIIHDERALSEMRAEWRLREMKKLQSGEITVEHVSTKHHAGKYSQNARTNLWERLGFDKPHGKL